MRASTPFSERRFDSASLAMHHTSLLCEMLSIPRPARLIGILFVVASILGGSLGLSTPARGQDRGGLLRGFITDETDGTPLPKANVVLANEDGIVRATATDGDGFYQLSDVTPGTYRLEVSYLGYETYRDTIQLGIEATIRSVALSPAPRELEEVTVEERREQIEDTEAGLERIEAADIERLPTPGPGADLATYLRSLPSVSTTGDRGGRVFVRGGTPSQNLILVDGTPIKKPFHIIGFYSAFPGDLISSADFYAGGFGARYTGRLSSVLDVNLRPGNLKQYQGRVEIGPFVSSVQAEGPFDRGDKSLLVNYRQSVIEWTGRDLLGESTPYRFYDLTARVHTQGESSQCSFTGLRTYDRGKIDPSRPSVFRWTNTSIGGECLTFGGESSQRVYVSFGTTHFSNTVETPDGDERSAGTWDSHVTLNLETPYSWGRLKGGFWVRSNQFDYGFRGTFLGLRTDDTFDISSGGHVGATWNATSSFTVSPSFGMQVPIYWGSPTFEPRLRMAWQPGGSERTNITAAGGLYYQLLDGVTDERDAGSTFLAWLQTPRNESLQSTHTLLGVNHQITQELRLSVEGYYKTLRDIPVSKWSTLAVFNTSLAPVSGTAYGGSISLRYQNEPFDLRANYGIGKVEYRASREALGAWTDESEISYAPPHDQRHKVGLTAAMDLDLFSASVRWQYTSGRPFTQAYGTDNFLEIRGLRGLPRNERGNNRLLYEKQYNARLPAYHRLDVSAERTVTLSPALDLTIEGGAVNAYNRRNIFYLDLLTRERVDQLPLIPYLGLTLDIR